MIGGGGGYCIKLHFLLDFCDPVVDAFIEAVEVITLWTYYVFCEIYPVLKCFKTTYKQTMVSFLLCLVKSENCPTGEGLLPVPSKPVEKFMQWEFIEMSDEF